jgi:hypothetical protein
MKQGLDTPGGKMPRPHRHVLCQDIVEPRGPAHKQRDSTVRTQILACQDISRAQVISDAYL